MKLSSPLAVFLFLSGGVAAYQYMRQDDLDSVGNLVLREEAGYSGTGHLDARSQKPPVRGVAKGKKPAAKGRGFAKRGPQTRAPTYVYGWTGGLTPDAKCTNGSKEDGCRCDSRGTYLCTDDDLKTQCSKVGCKKNNRVPPSTSSKYQEQTH
ncbi:unnamed protein product [Clonostachys rhizophaga]|uniref:Uncharacterized protein n=1 Tax=Clonostachys rhizophaga TaxID=160324 RepID=A0A9N9VCK2_9HYPO|nr:unnamed protein product [Clonostachys rhizophaga]